MRNGSGETKDLMLNVMNTDAIKRLMVRKRTIRFKESLHMSYCEV